VLPVRLGLEPARPGLPWRRGIRRVPVLRLPAELRDQPLRGDILGIDREGPGATRASPTIAIALRESASTTWA
jgi:hypothetical protein